jgi:hypothetical protein
VKEDLMTQSRPGDAAVEALDDARADTADAAATADDAGATANDGATADDAGATANDGATADDAGATAERTRPAWRRRTRLIAGAVVTALATALVVFALVAPNQAGQYQAAAFLRIPIEGLVGFAVLLALPRRLRPWAAVIAGAFLGFLTIIKLLDVGFYSVLGRPFDPVLDWTLFDSAADFIKTSIGGTGRTVVVIAVIALAVALPVFMALAVNRLARILARHRTATNRSLALLTVVWVACAALGAQLVKDLPIASTGTTDQANWHLNAMEAGLKDKEAFARESAVDAFRDTPGDQLLTALRGKDVLVTFIESYGRSAIEDPAMASQVNAVLDAGSEKLSEAGFASRSGWLTSPTAGGGSWLAHATLLSGLWINNGQRHNNLLASDRLTLNGAFHRANWRTVGVMPAIQRAWPEGDFYGYDQLYDSRNMGYRGPWFSYAPVPDQYTLATFQRNEMDKPGRGPIMAEMPLVSSHGPWAPIPQLLDWDSLGDGTVYSPMTAGFDSDDLLKRSASQVRTDYRRSIEYSLNTLISYVEHYGNDNLVLVFLGDHQPAPIVTGENASRDVPITIVAKDPAVMDRVAGWNWNDGLRPHPDAPVWRMDAFRDKFLTAFSG